MSKIFYGFGYSQKTGDHMHEIFIKKHISNDEYNKHIKNMEFCRYYNHLKQIFSLVDYNSKSFLDYMDLISDTEKAKNLEDKNIALEGNRKLINYLTSVGMFIDYGEKEIGKALGKRAREEFRKKTHELYDRCASYRFVVLMRDYAIHYNFPLHAYVRSFANQSGLFANRDLLLRFEKWKHARADILEMPEKIRLEPHVIRMQKYIKELLDHSLLMFSSKLVEVIEYTNDLVKLSNGKRPVFIKFESKEKFRAGEFTMHPVDIGVVMDALNDLQSHPRITIREKNNHQLETHLEFYYNNEIIMEGPISYFKKITTNFIKPNNDDPILDLGDRFTIDQFPEEGVSTNVRVIKINTISNRLNGQPDTIQYFIEPYHE